MLELKLNAQLREQIHQAVVESVTETFQQEIVPAAKAGSPRRTGANAASIAVTVTDNVENSRIRAAMFTQSGHGYYVEKGTSHNRELTKTPSKRRKVQPKADRTPARPYLMPAFQRYWPQILAKFRSIVAGSSGKKAA
jgi:hypothetical protein